ncbi:ferrous iron transport protein A [Acetobacter sp. AN02]|uniref:FeoA family protein n=1 Tax=Acetobacter sp. AN02 TaxID=2894186 RepID=UPI0024344E2C|nr:FeoA family protein [Acetobacter sp. AN02]MDG6095602.1 ferrous iron transport protein A [Acetobacter sp. AN02]
MFLDQLPSGQTAIVRRVGDQGTNDPVACRLRELGFVPGEPVRIVARGPFGGDPVAVRIGSTRFALRLSEAARVELEDQP